MGSVANGPPLPIDPSYQPATSITKLSSKAPHNEILKIIERDGGVILTGFTTPDELASIGQELEAYQTKARSTEKTALHIIPKETLSISGLVGKSPTIARLCESPILEKLRTSILQEKFTVIREDFVEENTIDPLLSISMTFHIGYGAPRQRLHRDDNIHGIRHGGEFKLNKASQFACLIAESKTTRQNGATMFIPGSHKWDDERCPKIDEICFAGKLQVSRSDLEKIFHLNTDLFGTTANISPNRNGPRLRTHLSSLMLPWWRPQLHPRRSEESPRIVLH